MEILPFFVPEGKDALAAVDVRVGKSLSALRCEEDTLGDSMRMCRDLTFVRAFSSAKDLGGRFSRCGEKAQAQLVALPYPLIQASAFARFHLPAERCLRSGFDVDCFKLSVGRCSRKLPHAPLGGQQQPRNIQMQRREETPESRRGRQLRQVQNSGRYRLVLPVLKTIQVGKVPLIGQERLQKETKERRGALPSVDGEALFNQWLKSTLLLHGSHPCQGAVGAPLLHLHAVGRRGADCILLTKQLCEHPDYRYCQGDSDWNN